MSPRDLFPPRTETSSPTRSEAPRLVIPSLPLTLPGGWELVQEYRYGALSKVRFERKTSSGVEKTFRWYEQLGSSYRSGCGKHRAGLYRADEVARVVESGGTIYLNEGEKAADRLNQLDESDAALWIATCGPTGSGSFLNESVGTLGALHGAAEVIVVVDRDDAGLSWAASVDKGLTGQVGRLSFVYPKPVDKAADAFDHVEQGHRLSDFVAFDQPLDSVELATHITARLASLRSAQVNQTYSIPPNIREFPVDRLSEAIDLALDIPSDLRSWRDVPPPDWIAEGVLQPCSVTLLSGRGGVGKSLLAQDLIIRLAAGNGGRWLETFALIAKPTKTVLVEYECGSGRLMRRLRELVEGGAFLAGQVDLALANLTVFAAERIRDRGLLTRILPDLLVRYQPTLLVLDPLRCALPPDLESENDNVAVGHAMDFLVALATQLSCAVLVIDHDSKAGAAARGASVKQDAAAFVAHLTAPADKDPTYLELELLKQRDPGGAQLVAIRRVESARTKASLFPLRFERCARAVKATRGAKKEHRRAELVKLVDAHYAATGTGLSVGELLKRLGCSRQTVDNDLAHLGATDRVSWPSAPDGSPRPVYPTHASREEDP